MDGVVRGDALGPSTVFDELHYPGLTYMPSLRSTPRVIGRSAYAGGRSLYQGGRIGKRVRVLGGEWSGGPWSLAVHAMRTMVRPSTHKGSRFA